MQVENEQEETYEISYRYIILNSMIMQRGRINKAVTTYFKSTKLKQIQSKKNIPLLELLF